MDLVKAVEQDNLRNSYSEVEIGDLGVERVLPVHSPNIEKIEIVRKGRVRRAKLYYLRGRVGKAARITEKLSSKK